MRIAKNEVEKTKPILVSCKLIRILSTSIQELFHGLGYRKGYTALYVKSEFYEFWEINHGKQ